MNGKKEILLFIAVLLCTFSSTANCQSNPRVFLIGDSTMSDKSGTAEEHPERGWGQLLPMYFNEDISVYNHAVNGRSTKSFMEEGRWDDVKKALKKGDYVLKQFGHNDQKIKDPKRFTNPYSAYRRNLARYINETRSVGAIPIVLSSIVRRKFNAEGTLIDTHGAYPFVARQVANDMKTQFIDMQLLTEDIVISYGPEKSKELYFWLAPNIHPAFPEGKMDDTHLSNTAMMFAGAVAEELAKLDISLAQYLIIN